MHHHHSAHGITYIQYIYIYTVHSYTSVRDNSWFFLVEIKMSLDHHKAIIKWFSKELESEKFFQVASVCKKLFGFQLEPWSMCIWVNESKISLALWQSRRCSLKSTCMFGSVWLNVLCCSRAARRWHPAYDPESPWRLPHPPSLPWLTSARHKPLPHSCK